VLRKLTVLAPLCFTFLGNGPAEAPASAATLDPVLGIGAGNPVISPYRPQETALLDDALREAFARGGDLPSPDLALGDGFPDTPSDNLTEIFRTGDGKERSGFGAFSPAASGIGSGHFSGVVPSFSARGAPAFFSASNGGGGGSGGGPACGQSSSGGGGSSGSGSGGGGSPPSLARAAPDGASDPASVTASPVPEPGMFLIFTLGLAVLGGIKAISRRAS